MYYEALVKLAFVAALGSAEYAMHVRVRVPVALSRVATGLRCEGSPLLHMGAEPKRTHKQTCNSSGSSSS